MKDDTTAIYDVTYKIIVIGDRVGKSSLIQRYTKNTFSDFGFDTVGTYKNN
jgi:GTPase SAR1 family protein